MKSKHSNQSCRILFLIIIPALILIWSKYTSKLIHLPLPRNLIWSYGLLMIGFCIVIASSLHLWNSGKGLTMTEFPAKNPVKKGIYAFMKYPFYAGTIFISFGLSVLLKLPSGFWLVSPLITLMMAAYIVGFEIERFPGIYESQDYKPYLSLPLNSDESPAFKDRLVTYVLAYMPFRIVYEAFIFAGPTKDAICTNLSFENHWPVMEFSVIFYELLYPLALLIPIVIKSKKGLRTFIFDIWFVTIISGLFFFIFPFVVKQRFFIPETFLGNLLLFDRSLDGEAGALPSFHVIWACLAARYFTLSFKKIKSIWYLLAILISISCITTANHSILDVIAGAMMFMIIVYRIKIWNFIRLQSEHIAHSWTEWRFGKVRLVNHGFYAGAAGFVGTILAGSLMGSKYLFTIFIVTFSCIIAACICAQFIKGSSRYQRTFCYYGGVLGVIIGIAMDSILFPVNFYFLLGVFALIAPWVQTIGCLHCLVKGCCYGKPSKEWIGIRFTHPWSEVNSISGLNSTYLHPVQLYSIGTNLITGLILFRLFNLGMSATFITGIYLLLNGLGRFVEESFRGEAQTPYWAGMSIYQWMTLVCVLSGVVFTSVPGVKMAGFNLNAESCIWAIATGVLATIAFGVDFPLSNCRFARLTRN